MASTRPVDFTATRAEEGARGSGGPGLHGPPPRDELARAGKQAVLGPKMQRPVPEQSRLPGGNLAAAGAHPHDERAHAPARARGPALPSHPGPARGEPVMRVIHQPERTGPGSASALQRPLPRDGIGGRWRVQPMERDLAITRWREDPTAESYGIFCFVSRCADRPRVVEYVSSRRCAPAGSMKRCSRRDGRKFRRQDDQVETHTEIAVSDRRTISRSAGSS